MTKQIEITPPGNEHDARYEKRMLDALDRAEKALADVEQAYGRLEYNSDWTDVLLDSALEARNKLRTWRRARWRRRSELRSAEILKG